jgi:dienelactone hydrolase
MVTFPRVLSSMMAVIAIGALCACSSKDNTGTANQTSTDSGAKPPEGPCGSLPAIDDYSTPGPFTPATTTGSGPDGNYTLIAPATLGENGFKHPIITWGNGITTNPQFYVGLLDGIASHGFVIIASNSTTVNASLMTAGLDWLIQQNGAGEQFEGKLNTGCAATVGYSLGGGGAVQAGNRPEVLATVAFHSLRANAGSLNGPLLLITSTADGFVTKAGNAVPTYESSTTVPTFMATWDPGEPPSNAGHLAPLGDAGIERAPAIAWLRHWIYGDTGAKKYFYGPECILCVSPWTDIQRKNAEW